MGTVPVPALHSASTVLTTAETTSWYNAITFALKPPACRAYSNAIQSWGAGASYVVLFGAESFDNVQAGDTEMHSTSANTDRVTVRTAGRYDVTAIAQFSSASSSSSIAILKNGVNVSINSQAATTAAQSSIALTDSFQCAIGDYFQLQITTVAAGSIAAIWPCSLYVKWVSN